MLMIFESILPIFLLVLLGTLLKRWPLISDSLWGGLEQFGFYVLFPALLFETLAKADFSTMDTGAVGTSAVLSVGLMSALVLGLWRPLHRLGVEGPAFTSIFQTATRWNAFMALAIAEKLFGQPGLTLVAVVMAVNIIPLNVINVGVMIWFSGGRRSFMDLVVRIVSNPIILGAGLGVLVNVSGVTVYDPLMTAVDLVARSSLGLGLIMVGAGLRIMDALRPRANVLLATALKLLVFPTVTTGIAMLFDVHGDALTMLALSAAVPTAMNGYLLAKQMGGDAPLYAAAATVQTVAAVITIPLVLYLVGQLAAG
ncbi:MAG: AEC family transporter [Alphaproteobacteria bacterium]|nr:AEC family transporter [Rhizobiaceae bacterium]MBU3961516.1 AEC family transporter [Alphaproteobacteria bacterium]MBU4050320.1 AEC family transporter [Alphaproteobacteria bacterium]MBU4088754.1 AEC family transporter [Alphaproteobacteria bacterium]MBU4158252.1 AEC family transporter [Alphaproteobacteria bacterium]